MPLFIPKEDTVCIRKSSFKMFLCRFSLQKLSNMIVLILFGINVHYRLFTGKVNYILSLIVIFVAQRKRQVSNPGPTFLPGSCETTEQCLILTILLVRLTPICIIFTQRTKYKKHPSPHQTYAYPLQRTASVNAA